MPSESQAIPAQNHLDTHGPMVSQPGIEGPQTPVGLPTDAATGIECWDRRSSAPKPDRGVPPKRELGQANRMLVGVGSGPSSRCTTKFRWFRTTLRSLSN